VRRSISGALAEHARQETQRKVFLTRAAALVAVATVPALVLDELAAPMTGLTGPEGFLARADQVLRDAAH
jgi:hypothetical protein